MVVAFVPSSEVENFQKAEFNHEEHEGHEEENRAKRVKAKSPRGSNLIPHFMSFVLFVVNHSEN